MKIKVLLSVFLIRGLIVAPAYAEDTAQKGQKEQPEIQSPVVNLIRQLAKKRVLSKEVADELLREAEQSAAKSAAAQSVLPVPAAQSGVAAAGPAAQSGVSATTTLPVVEPVAPGVVRVPYIPESMKIEMTEQIKHEVLAQARGERWGDPGTLPGWLSRISFDGDFRLRYQRDSFPAGNILPSQYNPDGGAPTGITLIANTTDTHQYMRVQARFGIKAKVSDTTYTAFRLSTGTTSNPVSTNQTMGTGFNKYTLVWDRAYVHSDPYYWLSFNGGKMPNPWLSTDLVWDSDVNFEGLATQFKPKLSETWATFLTVGAFPYQDIQRSDVNLANSKWLYGSQLGVVWEAPDLTTAQFGIALYQFKNVEGTRNPAQLIHLYDSTAATGMQKGNTLMYVNAGNDPNIYGIASKFKELNLTARMDWAAFDPIHVIATGDYVKNLGYDQNEITQRTGIVAPAPKVVGYQAALTVGMPKIRSSGEWQVSAAYKYLERDAVLDVLTDSDFHLGGTNAKGYILSGSYGVDNDTWLNMRWISSDQLCNDPVKDCATLSIDTLQFDLNTRF